jgi:S1-C subfamily serine protease
MILEITSGADAGRTANVRGDQFTLGREGTTNLVLRDAKASRRHASLRELPDGRVELTDLGSRNGTFVNGQQLFGSIVLSGGEEIRIGDTVLRAHPEQRAAAPQPPPPIAPPFSPPPPQQPQQPAYPVVTQSAAPPPPGPSASTMQRLVIQRGLRRVTIIGIAVLVLLAIVIGGLVTGLFSGGSDKKDLSNAEVLSRSRPRTVLVVNNKGGGTGGRGSGWVWDAKKGIIVTNAHVVAGGRDYTVATGDKLTVSIEDDIKIDGADARDAQLKGEADCEDIAVLQVDSTKGLQTMPRVSSKKELHVGDDVDVIGYPATLNLTKDTPREDADFTGNAGVISTVSTTFPAIPGEGGDDPTVGPYKDAILTDAVINQGNSGGPLVNHQGKLAGMSSAQRTDVQGQFYAVGIDRINEIVPRLIDGDDVC